MKKLRYIPFLSTSIREDICLAILLIPVWWILGVRFFIFHLIVLLVLLKFLATKQKTIHKMSFPSENFFLLVFIIIYCLSLLINLKNTPASRLFASLNNLSFWVMGLMIIFVIYNSFVKNDILAILQTFRNFGIICSIFALGSFSFWVFCQNYITTKSLLFRILPERTIEFILNKAPLIKFTLFPRILDRDKLFSIAFPRALGFNIFSTGFGATMLFLIAMTLAYYKTKKRRVEFPVVITLELIALCLSLTRAAIFGLLFAWFIVSAVVNKRKLTYLIISVSALTALSIFLILIPPDQIIQEVSEFKAKSIVYRTELYKMTISQAKEKLLLGYGFKPRIEGFPVPLGSHSMYMGVLYKAGFIGLFAFSLFWISILRSWWTQRKDFRENEPLKYIWYYSGIALIGGLFWMISEDLDAPPIVAFIYFIIIGFIISLNKLKNSLSER